MNDELKTQYEELVERLEQKDADIVRTYVESLFKTHQAEGEFVERRSKSFTVAQGRDLTGKYVIVRSRNEGVNAGYIVRMDGSGIELKDARRLWHHRPADTDKPWYEGVSTSGLAPSSKLSSPVLLKVIVEDYSVTLCTDKARDSIIAHPDHPQS